MEMFYLLLKLGNAAVLIPEKYPNLVQCEASLKVIRDSSFQFGYCIPAPKYDLAKSDKCVSDPKNPTLLVCPAN